MATMLSKPLALTAEDAHRYRVRFARKNGESAPDEFVFTVDSSVVPVVTWEHDFWLAMDGDLDPARDLFDAILAFHKARQTLQAEG